MFSYLRRKRAARLGALGVISVLLLAACSSSGSSSVNSSNSSKSGSSGKKYTVIGSCPVPQNASQCDILEYTAQDATSLSGGQLQFQLHYNSDLGTPGQVQTLLQQNQVQLAVTSTSDLTAVVGEFDLFNLPFLFSGFPAVHAVTAGPAGAALISELNSSAHIKLLGWEDEGFSQLLSRTGFVNSISDLKGQKIRVIADPLLTTTYSSLGAIPVPSTQAEVYTGYQTGEFSVAPFSAGIVLANKWQEVAKYFTVVGTGAGYTENTLIANPSFLSSLPANLATDLQKAVSEAEQKADTGIDAENAQDMNLLKTDGVHFSTMPSASVAAWKQEATQKVYPVFTSKYGSSLLNEAQASISG